MSFAFNLDLSIFTVLWNYLVSEVKNVVDLIGGFYAHFPTWLSTLHGLAFGAVAVVGLIKILGR